jgi:hypothetical protein
LATLAWLDIPERAGGFPPFKKKKSLSVRNIW